MRRCFKCRKHLRHVAVLLDDPPERQPSYYEPVWVLRCAGCGEDHHYFHGDGAALTNWTAITGITGIGVSGVMGPSVGALWATRHQARAA